MGWLFRKVGASGFATVEFRLLIQVIALAFIGLDLVLGNLCHAINSKAQALSNPCGFAHCSWHAFEASLITLAKLIIIGILVLELIWHRNLAASK